MPLRARILLVYAVAALLGTALAAAVFFNGRTVLQALDPLVRSHVPLLQALSGLQDSTRRLETLLYEYYATAARGPFRESYATTRQQLDAHLASVATALPADPALSGVRSSLASLEGLASALDAIMAGQGGKVDWDEARALLVKASAESRRLDKTLAELTSSTHEGLRRAGTVATERTHLTVVTVTASSAIILALAAFIGFAAHRFLLEASVRRRLSMFVEHNPSPVLRLDAAGTVELANPSAYRLVERLGLGSAGPRGLLPATLDTRLSEARHGQGLSTRFEHQVGETVLGVGLQHVAEFDIFHVYMSDITAQRAAQRRMEFLAYHDPLTGLPNRARLEHDVESASRQWGHAPLRVLLANVDNLRAVVQSFGPRVTDRAVVEVSRRVVDASRACAAEGPYRLDGDTFAVLHRPVSGADSAARDPAEDIAHSTDSPIVVEGQRLFLSLSVGVADGHLGEDVAALMRKASVALTEAKQAGPGNVRMYDGALDQAATGRLAMANDLREAESRSELWLAYQPQRDIASGDLVGAEALLRWRHPERGAVSPGVFIPVAEETALILPIGRWVMATAARQARAWSEAGHGAFRVAINVSARQFGHPAFLDGVREIIDQTGVSPDCLEMEITESIAMQELTRTVSILQTLRSMGIRLSIDDFGTGFSSLSYLKRLPIDKLKLDQSFVRGLPDAAGDRAIAQAVLDLGRRMDMRVVAEGVETAAQVSWLGDHGCHIVQGYYVGHPLAATEMRWDAPAWPVAAAG